MTAVPAGETGSAGLVCEIRELSFWQALEILDADFRASSARELTGGGSPDYYLRQAGLEWVLAERARIRATASYNLTPRQWARYVSQLPYDPLAARENSPRPGVARLLVQPGAREVDRAVPPRPGSDLAAGAVLAFVQQLFRPRLPVAPVVVPADVPEVGEPADRQRTG
jgi:hypothetical protein